MGRTEGGRERRGRYGFLVGTMEVRDVGRRHCDVYGFACMSVVEYWKRGKSREGVRYGYVVFCEEKEMRVLTPQRDWWESSRCD